jgi:hypothetical protein
VPQRCNFGTLSGTQGVGPTGSRTAGHPGLSEDSERVREPEWVGVKLARGGCGSPDQPLRGAQLPEPAHTWGHPRDTRRRAPVNPEPAIPRSMRSGSPSDSLLELGERFRLIKRQRGVGGPARGLRPLQEADSYSTDLPLDLRTNFGRVDKKSIQSPRRTISLLLKSEPRHRHARWCALHLVGHESRVLQYLLRWVVSS